MAARLTRKIARSDLGLAFSMHRVLDLIDLFVEMLDRRQRLIDRQLEEPIEKMVGAVAQAIAGVARRCCRDPDRESTRARCGR